jgi:Tol biopolymer transport system component
MTIRLPHVFLILTGALAALVDASARQHPSVARNPRIASMELVQAAGARPKWSPAGDRIVFDRRNSDGLYDLYVADARGQQPRALSQGRPIPQKHAGNGIYQPFGNFIVFQAQVEHHYLDAWAPFGQVPLGEPGVGLFNNLWATDGTQYWQLTDAPIKMTGDDGIPAIATVNPRFTWDSKTLIWTERHSEGGNNNWGLWQLKAADFVTGAGVPWLRNTRRLFTPSNGTYVTAMEVMGPQLLLVAGNLDGQHEYGMDLYLLRTDTGAVVRNLTMSPKTWEEGACVAPSGRIVYMSNAASRRALDWSRDWAGQPVERDYWIVNPDGSARERLTYFNDPTAPEYTDWRSVTIICDISPDGRTMAATIGRDVGDQTQAWVLWQLWLIRFHEPL